MTCLHSNALHKTPAELNLLKLPSKEKLPHLDALLLSDVLSTAWHATEKGDVRAGDSVAIWGAG